jgi:hypothetical protein
MQLHCASRCSENHDNQQKWKQCKLTHSYLLFLYGQTDRGKTVYPPPPLGSGGIIIKWLKYGSFIVYSTDAFSEHGSKDAYTIDKLSREGKHFCQEGHIN